MNDQLAALVYLALLMGSNMFWAWKCSRLLDRVMAKDFGDYAKIEKYRKAPQVIARPQDDEKDDYAANQADRANALMGLKA